MSWIGPAISAGGGLLQGMSASNAAGASADAMVRAAQIAADAAKFRPVGITTRFGSSNFQFDPNTGYLTGAGYNVSPELKGYQDTLSAMQGRQLGEAERAYQQYSPLTSAAAGLFNLGGEGLKATPEQMASDWMQKQQALLAPSREQQSANLMNQLSNTGRTGLSVAQGGGLMAANPEAAALANARAMQDLQLASQATQEGRNATNFYGGLFGTGAGLLGQYQQGQVGALSPFQTSLGTSSTIEQLGQSPLDIGAKLGGRSAEAGTNVGNFLMAGGTNAARTMQQANAYNPLGTAMINAGTNQQFQGLANNLGSWWNGLGAGGGITSNAMQAPTYTDIYSGGQLPAGYANL